MRRAVVTGASRGIGRAVTEMLLGEGWQVTGLSRTRPDLEHPAFRWWRRDIADPDVLLPQAVPSYDALVHCAGIRGPYGPFTDADPAAWVQTIATNLLGTARVVRAALPLLRRSDDGRILLFSGGGAFDAAPGYSAYAASKAGTVALMETLAAELSGTTVSVNCVAPGFVATDIHRGTPHEGQPDREHALSDAVACVRHLLSPAARGLSGRTVSAAHDDWRHINPWTSALLTNQGTRTRITIDRLEHLLIHRQRAV